MEPSRALRRYRLWYAKLIQLYPKPYYDRFSESMEQTFTDLLYERAERRQDVMGYAIWMYLETLIGIMKENKTLVLIPRKNLLHIVAVVATLLLIAFLAMHFQVPMYDPGSGFESGMNWTLSDFVLMGILLFIAGLGLDIAIRNTGKYKIAAAITIILIFLWIWAELAVGVFTNIGS